ncbi:MAG TPA: response regulator [Abditibacterium sp.]|jgi:CheY-like chemotaxis protein
MRNQLQRILLVEDDTDIQLVARLSLETVGGYTVEICSSGKEALQKIVAFAPDLVLLDVMMPDMDGPAVLQNLRAGKDTCHLPIVFMTAKAQTHEIEGYLALGAIAVVSKPFDPMTLPTTLSRIWQQNTPSASVFAGGEDR